MARTDATTVVHSCAVGTVRSGKPCTTLLRISALPSSYPRPACVVAVFAVSAASASEVKPTLYLTPVDTNVKGLVTPTDAKRSLRAQKRSRLHGMDHHGSLTLTQTLTLALTPTLATQVSERGRGRPAKARLALDGPLGRWK